MNKKIKGYELMKLIAENKIKEGQEFVLTIKNTLTKKRICWTGKNFIYCDTVKFVFGDNADIYFLLGDIEILEDEEETGISKLEKEKVLEENPAEFRYDLRYYYDKEKMGDKINEIIEKVNELAKKINKED